MISLMKSINFYNCINRRIPTSESDFDLEDNFTTPLYSLKHKKGLASPIGNFSMCTIYFLAIDDDFDLKLPKKKPAPSVSKLRVLILSIASLLSLSLVYFTREIVEFATAFAATALFSLYFLLDILLQYRKAHKSYQKECEPYLNLEAMKEKKRQLRERINQVL